MGTLQGDTAGYASYCEKYKPAETGSSVPGLNRVKQ